MTIVSSVRFDAGPYPPSAASHSALDWGRRGTQLPGQDEAPRGCRNPASAMVSFFPDGHKQDLITVPSRPIHNEEKRKDDRYFRNTIVIQQFKNDLGRVVFQEVNQTLDPEERQELRDLGSGITVNGQPVVGVSIDYERLERSVRLIASALYYDHHRLRRRQPPESWDVMFPALGTARGLAQARVLHHQSVEGILEQEPARGQNPGVFSYKLYDAPDRIVQFMMRFYEEFPVHVWWIHPGLRHR
jgi:hypothetical protein